MAMSSSLILSRLIFPLSPFLTSRPNKKKAHTTKRTISATTTTNQQKPYIIYHHNGGGTANRTRRQEKTKGGTMCVCCRTEEQADRDKAKVSLLTTTTTTTTNCDAWQRKTKAEAGATRRQPTHNQKTESRVRCSACNGCGWKAREDKGEKENEKGIQMICCWWMCKWWRTDATQAAGFLSFCFLPQRK